MGQGEIFEAGGYGKYLFQYSTADTHSTTVDHLFHGRLNSAWYLSESFRMQCELRFRIFAGKTVERTPHFTELLQRRDDLFHLDAVLWQNRSLVGYGEVDRLFAQWSPPGWIVSLGRQRIAWGTSLVWNVTDVFNPSSILDFDYEEKPAVDAFRLQYFPSELSKADVAIKLAHTRNKTTIAVQYSWNIAEYDVSVLGGKTQNRMFAGTTWAGNICGGGFRGEVLWMESAQTSPLPPSNFFAQDKRDQFSFVLSADYTFPNSLYLHSELLYNSTGTRRNAGLYHSDARIAGLLSPAKMNLFYHVGYILTPLIRLDGMMLHNPLDHSLALLPALYYSALENFDFSLIFLVTRGSATTEYSPRQTMIVLRTQYSF